MPQVTCLGCTARCWVADPGHGGGLCRECAAGATWEALSLADREAIRVAVRRGAIAGLAAMSAAAVPIRLPHAVDLLVFVQRGESRG